MNRREAADLDRHITGNYGEDQFLAETKGATMNTDVEQTNEMLAFMSDPRGWPKWPWLPMKKYPADGRVQTGIIHDDNGGPSPEQMSADEAFAAYCNWNGIVNWSVPLARALDRIRAASDPSEADVKRAINTLAHHATVGARAWIEENVPTPDGSSAEFMAYVENLIGEGRDYDSDVLEEVQRMVDEGEA